jgi:hypothetical protein
VWIKLFIFFGIVLFLFTWWQHKWTPGKAVIDMFTGIDYDDPQTLADAAGVDLDTYSLARAGQSEGDHTDRDKICIMYAVKNHADKQGKSITEIVTTGNPKRADYADVQGHYGRQGIHPYCSTIAAPTANTLSLAQSVIDGSALDEVQGAQWFDRPLLQDALALANPHKVDPTTGKTSGYFTSAEIAAHRTAGGATEVTIDGVSTRFWA